MENVEQQLRELSSRLKAFGLMVKMSHDLFNVPDFKSAAGIAVNSSRTLLNFRSSNLFELEQGRCSLVGQYSQVDPNAHAELVHRQIALCKALTYERNTMDLCYENIGEEFGAEAEACLKELIGEKDHLLAVELPVPRFLGDTQLRYVWLIEYPGEIPPHVLSSVGILRHTFGDALYSLRFCRAGRTRRQINRSLIYGGIALALLLILCIPVRESVNAEFVLKAPKVASTYAWFDGPVTRCLKQDGDLVREGEIVAEYDVSQLQFRLDNARSKVAELEQEYELENSAAFSDPSRLGKVQLLAARLPEAQVAVREAQWYLDHAKLKAPMDGLLVLADGRAELLQNKAVRTGDRIFEVHGGKGVVAEIQVDERDSSILLGDVSATLFLYTRPDEAIPTRIASVSRYSELSEQKKYCYKVQAEIADNRPLRYGMRGIAKVTGNRVSLGYWLFRSLVLYMRWYL